MSTSDLALRVRGLSKAYTLARDQRRESTLAETTLARFKNPLRRPQMETFWALKDVEFDVKKGDVVGIIGRNGAGKSTLLKVLSRITEPTAGRIELYGRVGSLLEVGTGFHPELTGRENIYLNGNILGMSRAEIRRQFDAIVDFAGVEKFLDTPVKRYSSGMYVRLAFAVAAHLRSEILIVDEVLAVGDAEFQKKCLGKMKDVSTDGRTVLFVSHNMAAVSTLCRASLLLVRGTIRDAGDVSHVVRSYLATGASGGSIWERSQAGEGSSLRLERLSCELHGEQPSMSLELEATLKSYDSHAPALIAFDIADAVGDVVMQALPDVRGVVRFASGFQRVRVQVSLPPLIPGRYDITFWCGPHNTETYDAVAAAVSFEVTESPTPGRYFPHTPDHGRIVPHSQILEIRAVECLERIN